MKYPYIVKTMKASKHEFSHNFFIVNNKEGLKQALDFEGFRA
jgi:hypothetical protein